MLCTERKCARCPPFIVTLSQFVVALLPELDGWWMTKSGVVYRTNTLYLSKEVFVSARLRGVAENTRGSHHHRRLLCKGEVNQPTTTRDEMITAHAVCYNKNVPAEIVRHIYCKRNFFLNDVPSADRRCLHDKQIVAGFPPPTYSY